MMSDSKFASHCARKHELSKGMSKNADRNALEFQEWLDLQPHFECPDPRYSIRRGVPADFPQIYALVDEVWERKRPKAQYDWLYLDNPSGIARTSLIFERATGQMVAAGAGFPWPIAKGDTRFRGSFGGDAVTIQRLQRTGFGNIKRAFAEIHPWRNSNIGLHAPNWKSRASAAKRDRPPAWGPLPVAALVLDYASFLSEAGQPRAVARSVGTAANTLTKLWHRAVLPSNPDVRVVDINRFDAALGSLSYRASRSDRYWCPHDDNFLNWRFFAHPVFDYRAVGLVKGDEWVAFWCFQD